MRCASAGQRHTWTRPQPGFTLLELLVVLAIVAMASASVGFAMRDGTQSRLEREALRLSALLESTRARSQTLGVPLHWRSTESGFLDPDTRASITPARVATRPTGPLTPPAEPSLLLGPEPIIAPQSVTLASISQPQQRVLIATDGVRPFAVQDAP